MGDGVALSYRWVPRPRVAVDFQNARPLVASAQPKAANATEGVVLDDTAPNSTYESDVVPKAARLMTESAVATSPSLMRDR